MITYLLKASACIAFVYIIYVVLLRHTNRFQLNRAYLLMGLVLSFTIPSIVLHVTPVEIVTTIVDERYVDEGSSIVNDVVAPMNPDQSLVRYLYYFGAAISLLITLRSVLRIVSIYHSGERRMLNGQVIVTHRGIQPFSFLGMLFIRSGDEDPMIIAHEMVHIRQHHWIDLLLVEMAGIILWFNPIVHFYRRSISIQHEYIADNQVISAVPVATYLECMMKQLEYKMRSGLASHFNTQSIKQRIIMITNMNNYSALRYAVVLPVVAFAVMAFATREASDIVPIQKKELRCPVDATRLKAGEGVGAGFGERIHPATNKKAFHNGVDFILPAGNSVYAAAGGTVVKAEVSGDYGNLVIIRHGKVLTTYYAHLEKMLVKNGDRVDAGELIGTVGSTGASTGPHLHFEVLENSKPVDPVPYLNMEID